MQTATLKEATTNLGISPDDLVHYYTQGDRAIIQIALKSSQAPEDENTKAAQPQAALTPEQEFRRKYPEINVESEFFRLVGSITVPDGVSDKDLIIDAIESIYGKK